MRAAKKVAAPFPTARRLDTPAVAAAQLLTSENFPGSVAVGDIGRPWAVRPGRLVLRLAVPSYRQDDPVLARVADGTHAGLLVQGLAGRTVHQRLPEQPRKPPVAAADATVLEVAAVIALTRTPTVAVPGDGPMRAALALDALPNRMLAS
jgi:hypothetical protein